MMTSIMAFLLVVFIIGGALSICAFIEACMMVCHRRKKVLPPPDKACVRNGPECAGEYE